MTTAARPTYFAAVGKQEYGGGVRSRMQSARDQIGHTKMKFRQTGQSTADEIAVKDLRDELSRKEQEYVAQRNKGLKVIMEEEKKVDIPLLLKNKPESSADELRKKYDDADVNEGDSDDGFDSSSDEEDDEDDDEAELQAELQRIREERELAQLKKQKEEEELAAMERKESALKSNPFAHIEENSSKIKRKWNDDVVFRNQARDEPQPKKRFINDTIRSDFHRSFLKKYIK